MNFMNRRRLIAWMATAVTSMMLVIGLQFVHLSPASSTTTLNVYAAVSLTNALNDIKAQYEIANPTVTINYTFGASGTLLSKIQAGTPPLADIFISAATDQIDVLQNSTPSQLVSGSRKNIVKNSLVLITPTTPPVSAGSSGLTATKINGLTAANVTGIAIGDYTGTPPVVPAGNYAKQVLTNRGIFTTVSPKLYLGSNVRTVLTAVENKTLNGHTIDAGFVYSTDAAISNKVKVVDTATPSETDPIVYPLGILTRTTVLTTAQSFSTYLSGSTAQNIFKTTYGFGLP
jgi:molybdate transport system substrate-binding protein